MDFPTLDISYKWNQKIYAILCLACFTFHNIFKGHLCCSMYQHFIPFFLQLRQQKRLFVVHVLHSVTTENKLVQNVRDPGQRTKSESVSHSCHVWAFVNLWTIACQPPCPWDSPGKNTGVSCHALIQGILHLFVSPALAGGFFTTSTTWEAQSYHMTLQFYT